MNFEIIKTDSSFRKKLCSILALVMVFVCIQPCMNTFAASTGNNVTNSNVTSGNVTNGNVGADVLVYELNSDGTSYSITECERSAKGALIIPGTYKNLPVTTIKVEAFYDCKNLTSVTIPESITEIGLYAFDDCTNLKSVCINDIVSWCNINFKSRTSNPLYYAKNLYIKGELATDIVIPENIESIKNYAFCNCESIKCVTIADTIESVGKDAFSNCINLQTVVLGNGVKSLGESAFDGCKKLESVTMPDNLTSIDGWAFAGCESLTSITIPASVMSIGKVAFSNCNNLSSVSIEDLSAWCNIDFGEHSSSNPLFFADAFFVDGKFTTDVIVPDGVTQIKNLCFTSRCITSITLPYSVTSVAENAFYDCSKLAAINVDENNDYYSSDDGVLFNKTKTALIKFPEAKTTAEYIIPDSVETIGKEAFYKCENLINLTIPDSVTSIGGRAFQECLNLTAVSIGNNVETIGEWAFQNCLKLTSLDFGGSVKNIRDRVFFKCISLTSLKLPDSVTNIGEGAFAYCEQLKTIEFGENIETVEENAFIGCNSLEYAIFAQTAINDISKYFSIMETKITTNSSVFIGTGDEVTIDDYGVITGFTCVVKNDVNGDGVCDVLDCAQVARASGGFETLEGAYAMAADSNSDDIINISDYQTVVNKAIS